MQNSERSILIKEGRVIDPLRGIDRVMDVVIEGERIGAVVNKVDVSQVFDEVIDAAGKWVLPGLTDMHVHLREPGREDEETIETGARAAAAGGFTAVACMPNTLPVLDDESKVRYVVLQGQNAAARVYPIGSVTKGQLGKELALIGEMVDAGAVAISEDGKSVRDAGLMRNALNYAKMFNIPVIAHCEDEDLSRGGCMNEGSTSTVLGIKGIPSLAEEVMVARDLILAEYLKARIHIAHVSTAGSIRLIREFKNRGVAVTAETAPHYFALTEKALLDYNTNARMNPPLRTQQDVEAIKQALADGTIDAIATDHAPHSLEEKDCEFEAAANGIIGLETSVALTYTHLVLTGILSPAQMVEKLSVKPNEILRLGGGSLSRGDPADITVFDPSREWIVDPERFQSKSRNTPFGGAKLKGKAVFTIMGGRITYSDPA